MKGVGGRVGLSGVGRGGVGWGCLGSGLGWVPNISLPYHSSSNIYQSTYIYRPTYLPT